VGRYILNPRIFAHLQTIPRGAGGEIQLTDAIEQLLKEEQVLAYRFKGKRYDCGSKLGYLQATVEYALRHPELRDAFRETGAEWWRRPFITDCYGNGNPDRIVAPGMCPNRQPSRLGYALTGR
jgi:dTDP-glucose pyrophosphorylase